MIDISDKTRWVSKVNDPNLNTLKIKKMQHIK